MALTLNTERFQFELPPAGRGFVFDKRTGDVFTLNKTGACILDLLMKGKEPSEIAQQLAAHYSVPLQQALADQEELIQQLRDIGVVNG